MPEGDSVAKDALRIRPVLLGERVVAIHGSAQTLRSRSSRLLEEIVDGIRTHGKNLVLDFSSGYSLRIHLGMTGFWRVRGPGALPRDDAGAGLETVKGSASVYAAPRVSVDRTELVTAELGELGPDYLAARFPVDEVVARFRRSANAQPVGEALLDQRLAAGLGNVYKSEIMFLFGIHPDRTVAEIGDRQLAAMVEKSARLLRLNVRSGPRSTTGDRVKGRETWVYGRGGKPCRKCRTAIRSATRGDRVTYWCPTCQPE